MRKLVVHSVFALLTLIPTMAFAAENDEKVNFEVSPTRCVTLRQGQPCYVRLKFKWSADEDLEACLYNLDGSKLKCWTSTTKGTISLSESLTNTTEFILADAQGVELNRATVSISWVYRKKRSKRRWRLF